MPQVVRRRQEKPQRRVRRHDYRAAVLVLFLAFVAFMLAISPLKPLGQAVNAGGEGAGMYKGRVISDNEEVVQANRLKDSINIKAPSVQQTVLNLSGGNQQKVVLAKWIFANPKLMILDEPTRGIDVGAKFEIYTLMNEMVKQGMSIPSGSI